MATATAAPSSYPLTFDVQYPESLNRWLIFVKWLLAIPHILILYVLQLLAAAVTFVAFFAILFTKKYPRGLFQFAVGVQRWSANVTAYAGLLRDEYPPFSSDPGQYPVTYDVQYPEQLNRWLPLVKWLLVIPNLIVLALLLIVVYFVWIISWFAILFTGRFPRGMFDFIVGALRWNYRLTAYANLMRDEYPPFSMEP
jgi:hypothetical protein